MSIQLNSVVPWGRSLAEYKKMFSLSSGDLSTRILGCGDGPSSFNSEATELGGCVCSMDPIYIFHKHDILNRIDATSHVITEELRRNKELFVWDEFESPEQLRDARMNSMSKFLEDYEGGKEQGRYLEASLPELPVECSSFNIALCSHFLFLYSGHLTLDLHIKSICELLRVADEARIFPLVDLSGNRSLHVEQILALQDELGLHCEIKTVDYEFQKGADQMLTITRSDCNRS